MDANHLYIFRNKSYRENIIKIGMTTKRPESRAQQIYAGATGVPQPFDVLFACSVADCSAAESRVHRRLAAYRLNNSREFFRIPPTIARKIVLDICGDINVERQHAAPVVAIDWISKPKPAIVTNDRYEEKYGEVVSLSRDQIESNPVGTSCLTEQQKARISVVREILFEVWPDTEENWHDDFSRDRMPEGEIRIWEHIAKAFLKIDDIDELPSEAKREAYTILLDRSLRPSGEVLKKSTLRHLTKERAVKIMAGYELAPKPVTVVRRKPEPEELEPKILHPTRIASAIQSIFAQTETKRARKKD